MPAIVCSKPLKNSDIFKTAVNRLTPKNSDELLKWISGEYELKPLKLGNYNAYISILPNMQVTTHAAMILTPEIKLSDFPLWLKIFNLLFLFTLTIFILRGLFLNKWPDITLKPYFFTIYALTAVLPVSLYAIVAYSFLLNYRETSYHEEQNRVLEQIDKIDNNKALLIQQYINIFKTIIKSEESIKLLRAYDRLSDYFKVKMVTEQPPQGSKSQTQTQKVAQNSLKARKVCENILRAIYQNEKDLVNMPKDTDKLMKMFVYPLLKHNATKTTLRNLKTAADHYFHTIAVNSFNNTASFSAAALSIISNIEQFLPPRYEDPENLLLNSSHILLKAFVRYLSEGSASYSFLKTPPLGTSKLLKLKDDITNIKDSWTATILDYIFSYEVKLEKLNLLYCKSLIKQTEEQNKLFSPLFIQNLDPILSLQPLINKKSLLETGALKNKDGSFSDLRINTFKEEELREISNSKFIQALNNLVVGQIFALNPKLSDYRHQKGSLDFVSLYGMDTSTSLAFAERFTSFGDINNLFNKWLGFEVNGKMLYGTVLFAELDPEYRLALFATFDPTIFDIPSAQGAINELEETSNNQFALYQKTVKNNYLNIACSSNQSFLTKYKEDLDEILEELSDSNNKIVREMSDCTIIVSKPVMYNESAIVGCFPHASLQLSFKALAVTLVLIILLAVTLITLIAYFLSETFLEPVEKITNAMEKIKNGDYSIRLASNSRDEFGDICNEFSEMTMALHERNRIATLLSEHAIDALSKLDNASLKVSSHTAFEGAALVSDIRDFTTMCENQPPEDIIYLLNTHFEKMTEILLKYGGRIHKYIGDAIEAVFDESDKYELPAGKRAFLASVLMLEKLKEINIEREKNNLFTYKIGIGISYGSFAAGNIGDAETRMDYAILGKPMSHAATLESLSKLFPDFPLVADKKISKTIEADQVITEELDKEINEDAYAIERPKDLIKELLKQSEEEPIADFSSKQNKTSTDSDKVQIITVGQNKKFLIRVTLIAAFLLILALGLNFIISGKINQAFIESTKVQMRKDNALVAEYFSGNEFFENTLKHECKNLAADMTHEIINGASDENLTEFTLSKIADSKILNQPGLSFVFYKNEQTESFASDTKHFYLDFYKPKALFYKNISPYLIKKLSVLTGLAQVYQRILYCSPYELLEEILASSRYEELQNLGKAFMRKTPENDQTSFFSSKALHLQFKRVFTVPSNNFLETDTQSNSLKNHLAFFTDLRKNNDFYGILFIAIPEDTIKNNIKLFLNTFYKGYTAIKNNSADQWLFSENFPERLKADIELLDDKQHKYPNLVINKHNFSWQNSSYSIVNILNVDSETRSKNKTNLIWLAGISLLLLITGVSWKLYNDTALNISEKFAISLSFATLVPLLLSALTFNTYMREAYKYKVKTERLNMNFALKGINSRSNITTKITLDLMDTFLKSDRLLEFTDALREIEKKFWTNTQDNKAKNLLGQLFTGQSIEEDNAAYTKAMTPIFNEMKKFIEAYLASFHDFSHGNNIFDDKPPYHILVDTTPQVFSTTGVLSVENNSLWTLSHFREEVGISSLLYEGSGNISFAVNNPIVAYSDAKHSIVSFMSNLSMLLNVLRRRISTLVEKSRTNIEITKQNPIQLANDISRRLNETITDFTASILLTFFKTGVKGREAFLSFEQALNLPLVTDSQVGDMLKYTVCLPSIRDIKQTSTVFMRKKTTERSTGHAKLNKFPADIIYCNDTSNVGALGNYLPIEKLNIAEKTMDIHMATGKNISSTDTDRFSGEEYLIETSITPQSLKGGLISLFPTSKIKKELRLQLRAYIFFMLIMALIIYAIIKAVTTDLSTPINYLIAGIGEAKKENYAHRISMERKDELGELCKSFDMMIRGLEEKRLMTSMISKTAAEAIKSSDTDAARKNKDTCVILYIALADADQYLSYNLANFLPQLSNNISMINSSIIAEGGDIDKIMNGNVLAVFRGKNLKKVATSALKAAKRILMMQKELKMPLPVSIGINKGEVITGFLGVGAKRDFSVIGDTVNVSARLASLAQLLNSDNCLVSSSIYEELSKEFKFEQHGEVYLKGKAEAQKTYQLKI
ncbi:MAG: HAMP domain-containing protein [Candidatus Riflebacteria bacterium]|nr:HAMP domain-containing protein [Candidatus Riflebacteria bacterium]